MKVGEWIEEARLLAEYVSHPRNYHLSILAANLERVAELGLISLEDELEIAFRKLVKK